MTGFAGGWPAKPDDPRGGEEHVISPVHQQEVLGSPPLARGRAYRAALECPTNTSHRTTGLPGVVSTLTPWPRRRTLDCADVGSRGRHPLLAPGRAHLNPPQPQHL